MATEATHDADTSGDIAELERKVAELRVARAQTIVERDEQVRGATRAAAVLDGLARVHHELGVLARERLDARDAARVAMETATSELANISLAREAAERDVRDAEARLAVARETVARLGDERTASEIGARDLGAIVERLTSEYEETARAAADVTIKFEVARAEHSIAQSRDVAFGDVEATLDREQLIAATQLQTARERSEATSVEADIRRVRELEDRLGVERADLERRLRGIGAAPEPSRAAAPRIASETEKLPKPVRISLAARLARDLINPGANG